MNPYLKVRISEHRRDLHKALRVALGHVSVDIRNIERSYRDDANTSRKRLQKLFDLLNDVFTYGNRHPEQRVDLLVLPEVSVPHSWATFLTRWAREHQIGIICGLEHRVDGSSRAWNEVLAALPYRSQKGAKSCVPLRRLKRHYSPDETFILQNNGLKVASIAGKSRYQLIQWRGASFAIYNCYELASLEDRALFKGKVDFIVCSEYNRDVNYFSNLVEATARDLHCYVVQVNCSEYGDSRVVSPSKTEKLNPLRIKGGDNQVFLTMSLPLQRLRDHQRKGFGLQKDSDDYKPTPPGFRVKDAEARIKLGKKRKVQ